MTIKAISPKAPNRKAQNYNKLLAKWERELYNACSISNYVSVSPLV